MRHPPPKNTDGRVKNGAEAEREGRRRDIVLAPLNGNERRMNGSAKSQTEWDGRADGKERIILVHKYSNS